MSPFTDAEIAYMGRITLARLATIGTDGRPHVIPLTYHYNPDEDAIDIGGIDFAAGKKWRDANGNERETRTAEADVPARRQERDAQSVGWIGRD